MSVDENGSPRDATDFAELPAHLSAIGQLIDKLHDRHEKNASRTQRIVERMTRGVASPRTLLWMFGVSALWILANLGMRYFGAAPPDPPPFDGLQGALTLVSVMLTCMILTTQTRADLLAGLRAQLTLELAMLSEHKNAKTIALLEEFRRDSADLPDRTDETAAAMANSTDGNAVLDLVLERAGGNGGLPDD